jgi:tetratricopeptide (TPR) repeat protein
MKHFILLIGIILTGQSLSGQVNRYDTPAKSNYYNTNVETDWGSLFQIYQNANSIHESNAKIIDAMIDKLYEMKGQTDNSVFKNKLDEFLNQLKNLRMGSLVDAEVKIKKIDWAIRDEIEKLNSGIYTITKNEVTNDEKIYLPGSYIETMFDSSIRDRPDNGGKEIANTKTAKFVKIIDKINENYYAIEFNNNTGYLSKTFLFHHCTKEAYDQYYSNMNLQVMQEEFSSKYQLSQEAFFQQDFVTARKYIDELLAKNKHPDLYYSLGRIYSAERNSEKAIFEFTRSIDLNPNHPGYYYTRGYEYYRSKDLRNALIDFNSVINIDPTYTDTYFLRGLIKSDLGDRRGAIKDYDFIIQNHNDSIGHNYLLATVYNNKAYCLVELQDYISALPLVNKALNLNDTLPYIWDTRGELYFKTGKYQESFSDMNKAISLEENGNSYYYRGLAKIMLKGEGGCEDLSKAGEFGKMEAYEAIKKNCK